MGSPGALWAVTAHYAPPQGRPPLRRHPCPEDFLQCTVVGPASARAVETVLDMLDVPESVRQRIRTDRGVRSFVEGALLPNSPYPHHTTGGHYIGDSPKAPFVEWKLAFTFVTRVIDPMTENSAC